MLAATICHPHYAMCVAVAVEQRLHTASDDGKRSPSVGRFMSREAWSGMEFEAAGCA